MEYIFFESTNVRRNKYFVNRTNEQIKSRFAELSVR